MSGACFIAVVTLIGTFALSSTDKTKILSDPNKDMISHICLLIANVESASACPSRRLFLLCAVLQELSSHGV